MRLLSCMDPHMTLQVTTFQHILQLWGFSPVWVTICFLRLPALENLAPHSVHVWGFSLVWISMCWLKLHAWIIFPPLNTFIRLLSYVFHHVRLQISCLSEFLPTFSTLVRLLSCVSSCSLRSPACVNSLINIECIHKASLLYDTQYCLFIINSHLGIIYNTYSTFWHSELTLWVGKGSDRIYVRGGGAGDF